MCLLFWSRLKLRGYTDRFLSAVFNKAPSYDERSRLLAPNTDAVSRPRSHALILSYSRALHKCQLGRAMHEYKYLLPPHLRTAKLILAWRLPRKIAGIIVPFRYPRQLQPRTETDGDSTPLLAEAAAD